MVILVICGVSAVALIVIMGLAMKCKMRRDNGKSSIVVLESKVENKQLYPHVSILYYNGKENMAHALLSNNNPTMQCIIALRCAQYCINYRVLM